MAFFLPQRTASFALVRARRCNGAITKNTAFITQEIPRGHPVNSKLFKDNYVASSIMLPPSVTTQLGSYGLPDDTIAAAREKLEHDMKRNYTLNVGRAIETLRDEIPHMLTEAMDLSIFSEDVVLTDRPGHAIATGKRQYSAFLASLRMARRLTLSNPSVEIQALRYLDWRGEISVKFQITAAAPLGMEPISFDAISVYRLNEQGLIDEHRIDDVTRMNLFERPSLLEGLPLRNLVFNGQQPSPVPMPF
jgi:hypothetical protein